MATCRLLIRSFIFHLISFVKFWGDGKVLLRRFWIESKRIVIRITDQVRKKEILALAPTHCDFRAGGLWNICLSTTMYGKLIVGSRLTAGIKRPRGLWVIADIGSHTQTPIWLLSNRRRCSSCNQIQFKWASISIFSILCCSSWIGYKEVTALFT